MKDFYVLNLEIDELPKMMNQLHWTHWTVKKKHTDLWRHKVLHEVGEKLPQKPLERASVTLTRCSSRECDFDGLVGSFKPILDALVKIKIIQDDKPSVIGNPIYLWEKASPRKGKIKINVKEIENEEEGFSKVCDVGT